MRLLSGIIAFKLDKLKAPLESGNRLGVCVYIGLDSVVMIVMVVPSPGDLNCILLVVADLLNYDTG